MLSQTAVGGKTTCRGTSDSLVRPSRVYQVVANLWRMSGRTEERWQGLRCQNDEDELDDDTCARRWNTNSEARQSDPPQIVSRTSTIHVVECVVCRLLASVSPDTIVDYTSAGVLCVSILYSGGAGHKPR